VSAADPIDLRFRGFERAVGCYLIDTPDGPVLHDCGSTSSLPVLKEALAARGLQLQDIGHLLLSHIHLDHAGAAGALVREHPDLQVWVSEIGAPHLIDPSRLEKSARRLYGEDMAWFGEIVPVPERNIAIVTDEVLGLECFATPGHASHHVAYFDRRDGTLYPGDTAGVRILPAKHVAPLCPPPDVDLDAWHKSLDAMELRGPKQLALIHFGVVTDIWAHFERMRRALFLWGTRVRSGQDEEAFIEAAREDALKDPDLDLDALEGPAPFSLSYLGLKRYWDGQLAAERVSGNTLT
jgi:glyoxylase-like metal-dependent hydrolase (beta-lactamase superfamily II)